MKFDELDLKMRVYETSHDRCVLPKGRDNYNDFIRDIIDSNGNRLPLI
jgi:hypothetical protein